MVHSGATVYRLAKRLFRTCGRAQRKIIRAMILRIDLWE